MQDKSLNIKKGITEGGPLQIHLYDFCSDDVFSPWTTIFRHDYQGTTVGILLDQINQNPFGVKADHPKRALWERLNPKASYYRFFEWHEILFKSIGHLAFSLFEVEDKDDLDG